MLIVFHRNLARFTSSSLLKQYHPFGRFFLLLKTLCTNGKSFRWSLSMKFLEQQSSAVSRRQRNILVRLLDPQRRSWIFVSELNLISYQCLIAMSVLNPVAKRDYFRLYWSDEGFKHADEVVNKIVRIHYCVLAMLTLTTSSLTSTRLNMITSIPNA